MTKASRTPPFNEEAEIGVLGSILVDNDSLHEITPFLKAEDFFRDVHQILYRQILELHEAGEVIDPVIICDALSRGKLDKAGASPSSSLQEVGGIEFLHQILQDVPHAANAAYYAQIVRQKARAREMIDAAIEIAKAGYADRNSAEELLSMFEAATAKVGEAMGSTGIARAADAVTASLTAYQERIDGVRPGLSSGLKSLDKKIGGFRPGRLYIVAARPSIGKSSLVTTFLGTIAEAGDPCLLFSLEMDSCEVGDRLLCGDSGVDGHRYLHPTSMIDDEVAAVAESAHRVSALPLLIDDRSSHSVGQIMSVARRAVARDGVKLIAIDYLQLLQADDPRARQSRQEFVADTTRRLKNLAKDLAVPVVLVSQLNRQAESTESKRPSMSHLRESGAIEQDANVVLLLHRPDFYDPMDEPGVSYLIVAKNRGGPTGDVKLEFKKGQTRFVDYVEPPEDVPYLPPAENNGRGRGTWRGNDY